MSSRIRIRCMVTGQWRWQLITFDEHVANQSELFSTRDSCEADALKQGFTVMGVPQHQKEEPRSKPKRKRRAFTVRCSADGLWTWRDRGNAENIESACAFLTREECIADAKKHGYLPAPTRDASATSARN